MRGICRTCGNDKDLKRGWTNFWYCCKECELSHVSALHGSMPGTGPMPRPNWVPYQIGKEIQRRWEE